MLGNCLHVYMCIVSLAADSCVDIELLKLLRIDSEVLQMEENFPSQVKIMKKCRKVMIQKTDHIKTQPYD